jgi:polysaccharide export outer membrane protein
VAACALILACGPLWAAQTPAATVHPPEVGSGTTTPATSSLDIPDYVISPDDVLSISVFDAPDVTGDFRVSPTGQIALPLLSSPIRAAGHTPGELSSMISEEFRKTQIYSHARVTVAIKESRVHAITIAGAVRNPQLYPAFGKTTILDVLSQAQGLAEDAGSLAIVSRGVIGMEVISKDETCKATPKPPTCENTFSVDLSRLSSTGDPLLNADLYPGDRVTVQRAGIVYVVGAVNKPGGFPLRTGQDEMTVLQAVALAEDVKSTAQKKKAMIIRKNPAAANGRDEIPVDLTKVLAGSAQDTHLQANDVFFIPDSAGKKALVRGAEAALQAATLAVVYVH